MKPSAPQAEPEVRLLVYGKIVFLCSAVFFWTSFAYDKIALLSYQSALLVISLCNQPSLFRVCWLCS